MSLPIVVTIPWKNRLTNQSSGSDSEDDTVIETDDSSKEVGTPIQRNKYFLDYYDSPLSTTDWDAMNKAGLEMRGAAEATPIKSSSEILEILDEAIKRSDEHSRKRDKMMLFVRKHPNLSRKKLRRSLKKELSNQGNGGGGSSSSSSSSEEESVSSNNQKEILEERRKCLCHGDDGDNGKDEAQW